MSAYLTGYEDLEFEFVPCFHSVRVAKSSLLNTFPIRFIRDLFTFTKCLLVERPIIVHFLAQYRTALPRELFCCWIARLLGRNVFYEIKAGVFDTRYREGGSLYKWMVRSVIASANEIGVEGARYREFVQTQFGRDTVFLPNICLDREVSESVPERFHQENLRVLFVGYCYEGKGVFELVEGCKRAVEAGCAVDLYLVGEQAAPFESWLKEQSVPASLTIHSVGRVEHSEVLNHMMKSDIFCLPSKHSGEGHNNSINEAMMCGCLVLSTRHGFLGDILNLEIANFIEQLEPEEISRNLIDINQKREMAKTKAEAGRTHFLQNYVSSIVFPRVTEAYRRMKS